MTRDKMSSMTSSPHLLQPRLALVCWWTKKQKDPSEEKIGGPQRYTQLLAALCEFCNKLEKHEFVVEENEDNASLPETSTPLCKTVTDADIQYSIKWYWDHPSAAQEEGRNSAISHEWNLTLQRFQVVGIDLPEFVPGDRSDYNVDIRNDGEKMQDGDAYDTEEEDDQTDDGCFTWTPPCEQVDWYGNTALISAATVGDFERMKVLLSKNVNIDARNKKGRSALMEAAFLGRTKAVKLLLENEARTELRDVNGRTALDLAENNQRMNRKRKLFFNAGLKYDVLSGEEPSGMDRQRQLISALLRPRDMISRKTQDRSIEHIDDIRAVHRERASSSRKSLQNVSKESTTKAVQGTVSILTSVAQINVANVHHKTVGIMHRGAPFPPVLIGSGWTVQRQQGAWELHNRNWTRNVMIIGRRIGFQSASHCRDSSGSSKWPPGTYNCSHAEKKLMAYCVLKHPDEPHRKIRSATIQLDRFNNAVGQCEDCKKFQHLIEATFGIRFEIELIERESPKKHSTQQRVPREPTTPHVTRLLRNQTTRVAESTLAETRTPRFQDPKSTELFFTLQEPLQTELLIYKMASEVTTLKPAVRAAPQTPRLTVAARRVTKAMSVSPSVRRSKRLQGPKKNSQNHARQERARARLETRSQSKAMLTFLSGGILYTARAYNSETVKIGFDLTGIDEISSAQVGGDIQQSIE